MEVTRMGVGLLLAFHKKVAGADTFSKYTDGKGVAAALPLLDEIAGEKGFTPLSHFIPDWEELVELAESDEVAELPETWFSSAAGLRSVSGLLAALKSEPNWLKRVLKGERAGLIACLELLVHDLKLAKGKRARFYLDFT